VAVISRPSERQAALPRRWKRSIRSPATTHPPLPPETGRTLDFGAPRAYALTMGRPLRLALQLVLFFMLLAVVIAIAAPETGPSEKGALLLLGAGLVWLAWRVRQTTRPV
jgi:hypothetical protein